MENKHLSKAELLAPAQDFDCFAAALNAGADAVYLGLDRFSARAGATNFTQDELIRALDIAHLHGRKIYLTVNTLFKDHETDMLYDLLNKAYMNGLDAVIVQDIGVISLITEMFPLLPVHASTQAAVTGSDGIRFLQEMGVKRVVPARELSLSEIQKLIEETGAEIECFIHGSLCYSYSGKCLLSSFIGGRSGNRGRCAQPCRLPYDDSYLLSLKDLCTIDILPRLIKAGICSFKIEGRMKNAGYVYGVTSLYRKYMDMYYDGRFKVDPSDKKRLISYYTRGGNCEGYYDRHNGKEMITFDSPSYRTEEDVNDNKTITAVLTTNVDISCTIEKGRPVSIKVFDEVSECSTDTDIVPEPSVNHPLTNDEVIKQLKKSGQPGVLVRDAGVKLDDGLFLTKAQLNSVRRSGLESYIKQRLLPYKRISGEIRGPQAKRRPAYDGACEVRVMVNDRNQLYAASKSRADALIVPISYLAATKEESLDFYGKRIHMWLPYVIRDNGKKNSPEALTEMIRACLEEYDVAGAYISNLESIGLLKKAGFKGQITGDLHLYAYNGFAYDVFDSYGINTTVPVELNSGELTDRGITGEDLIVYGRIPVMVSANCVYNSIHGCKRSGEHKLYLKDRKGHRPYVHCICDECTNVIYNSVRTCITDETELIERIKPSSVRFMFTDETGEEVSDILDRYYDTRISISTKDTLIAIYTKGHLKRGVD